MNRQQAEELIESMGESALFAEGFDDAIIGITTIPHGESVIVYDYEKCIEVLRNDMTEDDAREFFEFNCLGAYVGPQTPLFVHTGV